MTLALSEEIYKALRSTGYLTDWQAAELADLVLEIVERRMNPSRQGEE